MVTARIQGEWGSCELGQGRSASSQQETAKGPAVWLVPLSERAGLASGGDTACVLLRELRTLFLTWGP